MRSTLTEATRMGRMGTARATIREVDDDHLMQEVKYADVYHSETPTDFERWQSVGMTAVPIKQQDDPGQKQSSSQGSQAGNQGGDWNHDQPKGPAAEAVMLYLNGSRSHPIALVDDRRVRPYGMSEGEGAHYAPDGSEQMVLFKETGTYVVSLDGPSVKDKQNKKTRFVSLRHVSKKMQTHKIEKQQAGQSQGGAPTAQALDATGGGTAGGGQGQQQKYKHEGDTVNTEVRCTKDRIEFRAGDTVFGYFEVSSQTWYFKGKIAQMEFETKISEKVGGSEVEIKPAIVNIDSGDVNLSKNTWIGQPGKDSKTGPQVTTLGGPAKQAYAEV